MKLSGKGTGLKEVGRKITEDKKVRKGREELKENQVCTMYKKLRRELATKKKKKKRLAV